MRTEHTPETPPLSELGRAIVAAVPLLAESYRPVFQAGEQREYYTADSALGIYFNALWAAVAALGPLLGPQLRAAEETALLWRLRLGFWRDATPDDVLRLRELTGVDISTDNLPEGAEKQARALLQRVAQRILCGPDSGLPQVYPGYDIPARAVFEETSEIIGNLLVAAFERVWWDGVEAGRVQVRIAWRELTSRGLHKGPLGFPSRRTAGRLARRYPGRIRIEQADIRNPYMVLRRDGGFLITYPRATEYPGKNRRRTPPRRRRM